MTLVNRVSMFFLAALAVVLLIFSAVFYSACRHHVLEQFDRELLGSLNSLVAAAEVEETEVKWQPLEHSVTVGSSGEYGAIDWAVIGDRHLVVEQSRNASDAFLERAKSLAEADVATGIVLARYNATQHYQYYCHRLIAPKPGAIVHEPDEFDEALFVVGRSTLQRDAILHRLALLVTVVPLLTWLLAAVLGRWIVRKAILPVSKMARQAQSIGGVDFQSRLNMGDSGDELSELGTAFNRLLDRQQIAMEQQRRFAGDAAHELRTPITVLLGQVDVALRRPRSEAEYQTTLSQLRSQAGSLQEIVESLLFLARSDGDAIAPHTEPIELARWLTEHRQTWNAWPRSGDIHLDVQFGEEVRVLATPSLLARVIDNLVSNACKYGTPHTPVIITAQVNAGQAELTVRDTGPGIASDDLPHVFEPFYRAADARRAGHAGTGLGLAISNRIATALGGELKCESSIGVGSRFILRLPVCG